MYINLQRLTELLNYVPRQYGTKSSRNSLSACRSLFRRFR